MTGRFVSVSGRLPDYAGELARMVELLGEPNKVLVNSCVTGIIKGLKQILPKDSWRIPFQT